MCTVISRTHVAQDWSTSLCPTQNTSSSAPCPTLCGTLHQARALLPHLFRSLDLHNTATIYGPFSVALLRNYHLLQILQRTESMLGEEGLQPSRFQESDHLQCTTISFAGKPKIRTYVRIGSGDEEKWFGSLIDKPHAEWNASSETTMQEFAESGHPVFRFSSPLSRCVLKRGRQGKVSMHCNGQPNSAEVQMTNISSINQLSIYRAVLTWYLERRSEGDKCFSKHPPPHFTRTRDKTSTCRREIDRVPHTKTVQSNSRAGDQFLAKQDSRSL